MKKAIASLAALAILSCGYAGLKTNYKRIPDIAGLFGRVVIENEDYERALLSELAKTGNEATAVMLIESGYEARKRLNSSRVPAEGFSQHPYDLRIDIVHAPEGDEAYLIDISARQKLPIYAGSQVGDLNHRLNGMKESSEKAISGMFDEAKKSCIRMLNNLTEALDNGRE